MCIRDRFYVNKLIPKLKLFSINRMFVVKKKKYDASKKGAGGYVSSSIFQPTGSESEMDA